MYVFTLLTQLFLSNDLGKSKVILFAFSIITHISHKLKTEFMI